MIVNALHSNMLTSPSRTISGKVELYNGSTLTSTFFGEGKDKPSIASFTVNRACDTKFFGFGICQELELHLVDKKRAANVCKNNILKTYFGVDDVENNGISYVSTTPKFYVTDVSRDENSNALTVKASDVIYKTRLHTLRELNIATPYTIRGLATAIARFLGLSLSVVNVTDNSFDTEFNNGINLTKEELLRAALDDIAEATQTIYYIDSNDNLVFKRLDVTGAAVLTVDKSNYYTLKAKDALTLTNICHTTELESSTAFTGAEGITQYVRENGFWNIHPDLDTLLNNAIAAIGGLSIEPFNCEWRGNYLLELGDKVNFTAKDDVVTAYLLNDKYTYNGGLTETSSWEMPPPQEEAATNPTNLSDKLSQTFARVDKIEQNITLYVGEVVEELVGNEITEVEQNMSQLELTTNDIAASVVSLREATSTNIDGVNEEISKLTQRVDAVITSEDVTIAIQREMQNGIDKVSTSTGYTFDDEGLHIRKSSSQMESLLDEEGLEVSRYDTPVLTAKAEGVNALNITVRQYLNIGGITFEPTSSGRVGCFWKGE